MIHSDQILYLNLLFVKLLKPLKIYSFLHRWC